MRKELHQVSQELSFQTAPTFCPNLETAETFGKIDFWEPTDTQTSNFNFSVTSIPKKSRQKRTDSAGYSVLSLDFGFSFFVTTF